MVAVVDMDEPPPPELRLAWWCGDKLMPDSGGLLDQDYELWVKMKTLENVWRTISRLRNLKGEQIHSLSESERKLIAYLLREGIL